MKKLYTLFLLMLMPIMAFADAIEINGLYYNLITKDNVAELTSNPSKYTGNVVIPEIVSYNGVDYNVKSIGEKAFQHCTGLTSVSIPNSVTVIDEYAFGWCSSLTSIDIPNSVTKIGEEAFVCSGLTSITIPNSVKTIGLQAFYGCGALSSIVIPNSVTSLGGGSFRYCSNLTSVTISNSLSVIDSYTFAGCSSLTSVSIPSSITYIFGCAFSDCVDLKDVYCYATNVPIIANDAFDGSYPEYATLHVQDNCIDAYNTNVSWNIFKEIVSLNSGGSGSPSEPNVNSIEINGLYYNLITKGNVAELTSNPSKYTGNVVIPEIVSYNGVDYNVKSIGEKAFQHCTGLTSVSIPNSVTVIDEYAFGWCSSLTSIDIPNSVTKIGEEAFVCSGLTSITIPNSVKTIGLQAFYGCGALSSIVIPNSVTSLGGGSFRYCSNLTSVTISNSLSVIDSYTFAGCSSLTSVSIPSSITYIFGCAFSDCVDLKDVYCYATNVPIIANDAFDGSYPEYITLHVPEKSVEAYKANTIWGKFKEIIGFHVDEPSEVVEIVTPDGEVIKTEIIIEIIDENSKTAIIRSANIPASESGSTEIAIPAVVNGYTITSIDDNAFKGMTGVTDIYLPETDQPLTLGENALKIDDEHVATVHVPVGLLGSYAFNDQLAQNFNEGKVKATVTAPNRYWTFSAGVDVVVPEGVGVYICKYDSEDKVIITELDDSQLLVNGKRIIKANNGVLVACNNGTGGDAYDIVANPGGQSSMAPASYDAKSYGDDNMLEPVIVSKNYPATSYYVLKNGEFHKILANSSKMPAGKAVLRLPGVSNVRILSIIGGDDDTTGIRNRQIIEEESKWFDLQGRRIERPTKAGLYINNGKKVVIK